jgi:DNA repair protein RecN (Recombination protein N)
VVLEELRIRNLATIREVTVPVSPRLNILTGETGAGKSIVVDALKLLAGDRTDPDLIRHGEATLTVEAVFRGVPEEVRAFLESRGVEADDQLLILKREVHREKPGRVFINRSPVPLKTLAELGERIIAIHGQAEQLSLLDERYRLDLLDAAGGLDRAPVAQAYGRWKAAVERLEALRGRAAERARRVDVLGFAVKEIDAASPRVGEEEELKASKARLKEREAIAEALGFARSALDNEEASLIGTLREIERRLEPLAELMPPFAGTVRQVREAREGLEDVCFTLDRELSQTEAPEITLDAVESRLAALDLLKKKYGATLEAVLEARERMGRELAELEDLEGSLKAAEAEMKEALAAYAKAAGALHKGRKGAAKALQSKVQALLPSLSMEKAEFRVQVEHDAAVPTPAGSDAAVFLIRTNPGEGMLPLEKMASGGELSRVQLALQQAVQARRGKVLVFDEVDQGIGGRAATAVGRMLRSLAEHDQILCVSHLPQVAVWADHHLKVDKKAAGDRTVTSVEPLEGQARVKEVARMLGGDEFQSALAHAHKLLSLPDGE